MRNDRPYGIPLGITYIPVMSKTFDRPKLDEDLEVGIRGLYQDHGYFKVVVDVKDLKTVDVNSGGIPMPCPGSAASTARRPTSRFRSRKASNTAWASSPSAAPIPTRGWFSSPNSGDGCSR